MHKPVLVSVDDDTQVLHAIERDLRHKYGQEYRIVSAESGASALEATRHLNLRGEPVALFLVDQRMPGMTGIEFLAQVIQSNPDAKRVLLTAYSDTNAAIQSINEIRLDYYILKPWDPPEENVYPILDDLLADWQADYRPPFEGIRLLGYRWSPQFHEMKEFLARNLLPFRTLDVELDAESGRLLKSMGLSDKPDPNQLPIVAFPDGSHLMRPTENQLAEHAGLQLRPGLAFYDLIVVGAGPAGLSASVYASRRACVLSSSREKPPEDKPARARGLRTIWDFRPG
jgi:thioredoxin reductase (NADPH)